MRKLWIGVSAVTMVVSLGAWRTAAQGPQGVGGGEPKQEAKQEAKQSSHTPHSYNPVKWIKKDAKSSPAKAKKENKKKSSANATTKEKPAQATEAATTGQQ